jgi:L-ascorbate metabolism protein UlaG (beta-lactamase superfamily)
MSNYYLKPSIKAEPLVWQWYAWPHLVPPMQAACNIVERHLKIMQSYVQNPLIHAQAVKDPNMLGGPFIDLDGQKVEEIKELIHQTKKDCEKLIILNDSFKELDRSLQNEAQGDTLETLYSRIPYSLKGFVELVYDLNNHASIRLLEPLLYKTYYTHLHQKIALSDTTKEFRKFVLSTPRLQREQDVYLNIPFSDPRLDKLFKLREEPQRYDEIQKLFDIPDCKQQLFKSFFTLIPPTQSEDRNYLDEGIRIRYFGHACVLVQTKTVSILLDPVVSYLLQENEAPKYTFEDLPSQIDYVIITHNHQDHLMFETLLQLRHKIKHIVFPGNHSGALEDPSIKLLLKYIGFSNLIEVREMESITLEDGEITALPFFGEHSDLNIQSKLSFCIQLKKKNFMFAADSSNLEPALYEHIFKYIGPIDFLFLGMECDGAPLTWLYGPLLSKPLKRSYDRNRSLSGSNFEKGWAIAEKSKCKKAYIYAMGQEPWLSYIMGLKYTDVSPQIIESNKFIQTCKEHGIESERLFGKKEWHIIM